MLSLGFDGFSFDDLYQPQGLERLHQRFLAELEAADARLAGRFSGWRTEVAAGVLHGGLSGPRESALLIEVAAHVSRFVGRLFRVEGELEALRVRLEGQLDLFEFRREFVNRRVFKKGAEEHPGREALEALDEAVGLLLELGFSTRLPSAEGCDDTRGEDSERAFAQAVLSLMQLEQHFAHPKDPRPDVVDRWASLKHVLTTTEAGRRVFGVLGQGDELAQVRSLVTLLERWTWARATYTSTFEGWATFRRPKPLVHERLVEHRPPPPDMPELIEAHEDELRFRDGFKLTDRRFDERHVMGEVDTCVLCHEREKDSCTGGFKDAAGEWKANPLGIPLAGCPLEEHISEMQMLKARGDSLGALVMVMLENPMCPGTGHRICNDCMRACVFQKQDPVDIPQVETSALTDVLALPYGFEIFGLLTRWNPLNVRRPFAAPYHGKNVLVVGLGPAGYTLSHYLLNEGFAVVGIDGLKIEPFPEALELRQGPIRDWRAIASELDGRVVEGFGGVSEYGITVRWDKTFLTLLHLTLVRREGFKRYGGVRFGGTMTLEDAWELGFHHVALAAGAGKPTIVPMKNGLVRGVRAASDFLMALQLTGAFKRTSLANLQVRLPAVVIGGGLTGIDTATELLAYYPVQVERVLDRHECLVQVFGEEAVLKRMSGDELEVYHEFLEHGRAVRAERRRAEAAGEAPRFVHLVRQWGGVSLCYRRGLTESPAYRLNHEEVVKALEEGIRFVERVSPVEAMVDAHQAVRAVRFERMAMVDGKLRGTGQSYELPARTVCVAAGTSPNVTYEKEYPGTFRLDARGAFFRNHEWVDGRLVEREAHDDIGKDVGFFTSYERGGRYVTFYGDNHPTYAGNVVKAMASAKDGYPHVVRLFEAELKGLDPAHQGEREAARRDLFARLDEALTATVVAVERLTPTIVEVVMRAPFAARHFQPGQFFRLQNFERTAPVVRGTPLAMEGLALTGAWVDKEKGLIATIVLEMGTSSRLCATLRAGQRVVLMGPTGAPTEIPRSTETVLLAGGGLGNAVLFSIGQALKAAGCRVLYFAGFRRRDDAYKVDELEAAADQVIWAVDSGEPLPARRAQDRSFVGNIVQALVAYAEGRLDASPRFELKEVDRIIAIGSDRMMRAVHAARHGVLKPYLKEGHAAIGSINSPMQCMMKEICAQCLQRHVDPRTGQETFVFSCSNQDQDLDRVDFDHLDMRLKANSVLEKQTDLYLTSLLREGSVPRI